MRGNRIRIYVLFMALGLTPLTAHAADDLFDSKAATEHIQKGIALLKAKNFDAAIEEFDASASIAPEAEAYYYLGYAYYLKSRKGDEESRRLSLENFQKAYEIDPNFTPIRYKPVLPPPAPGQQPEAAKTSPPAVTQQAAPEAEPQTAPQTPPVGQ
jgi:tetratricopeptide (TPR) repeat protein